MDPVQLKESIFSFSLDDGPHGDQGYSRVLLQLFGYTGHGKSSFINSCKYMVDDSETYTTYADPGKSEEKGAMTLERTSYELTENITIVDNRGYGKMNSLEKAEIYVQLGNFIPIGEKVEWMDNYTDMMNRLQDADLNPNYSDFIVPILVHSAAFTFSDKEKKEKKERKEVQTFMENCVKMTGVVPIVVITNKKRGDFIECEKEFTLMGAEEIIAIENYTERDQIKTLGRTKDILTVLQKALENVKYRLTEGRDARRDWVERKRFLLEFIYKANKEKKEEEQRRAEVDKRLEEKRREEEKRRAEEKRREEEQRREEEWRRRSFLWRFFNFFWPSRNALGPTS